MWLSYSRLDLSKIIDIFDGIQNSSVAMSLSKVLYKTFHWKAIHLLSSFLTTVALATILKSTGSAAFYSLLYFFSLLTVFFSFGLDIGLNYFIVKKELSPHYASAIIIVVTILA